MGIKYHHFQQDMIKTFPARELKTLWIWVAAVTHINIQNRAGEDWLRNETRFFFFFLQEPGRISLDPEGKVWRHGYL